MKTGIRKFQRRRGWISFIILSFGLLLLVLPIGAVPARIAIADDMRSHIYPKLKDALTINPFTAALSPCPAWSVVPSPNNGGNDNVLSAISAASPNEVWAVGYTRSADETSWVTLALRWDGQAWRFVPSPNPGEGPNYFQAVAALAANNVWVVGYSGTENSPYPFILHWDGSQWSQSRLPALDPSGNELYAISARAADDIWAVGSVGCAKCHTEHSLVMHYNGVDWSVTLDNAGTYADALFGVAALSATDVWAVGYQFSFDGRGGQPMTEHWDGSSWTRIDPPKPSGNNNFFYGVAAVAPTDVWAVGSRRNYRNSTTLFQHWDGHYWTQVDEPIPSAEGNALFSLASTSSGDIWGVGYFVASGVRRPLLMRYDGTRWTQDTGFPSTLGSTTLYGVTAVPGSSEYLAAGYTVQDVGRTFIERYSDPCAVPTAAPTNTPAPSTSTPTPVPVPVIPIPGTDSYTFPETGKTVTGLFLDYWHGHGELAQQGYPIADVRGEVSDLDHKPYTVQYFERAVFEYHPENQPPYNVLLSQLGTFRYKQKYPAVGGAPNQTPNQTNGRYFSETGHWVGGRFWQYWQEHGGLAQQGYPLSDEFTEVSDLNGQPYKVQYFERAVFELHPENQPPNDVLLSQLGTFQYKQKYGK